MLGHSWKRFARAFIEEDIYSGIPRKRCLRTHESGGMHEQSFLDVRLLQIAFRRMFGTNKLPGTPLSCAMIEVDGAGRLNKATYRRTGKAVERTHRTCESPNTKTDSHRDSRSVRSNIHTPQEQAVGGRTRSANATFFFFSFILLHPRGGRVVANPQQDDVKCHNRSKPGGNTPGFRDPAVWFGIPPPMLPGMPLGMP